MTDTTTLDPAKTRQQSKSPATLYSPPNKTIEGVQVDVVYVAARDAKTAKTELASRNFLDKRYKMIKVDSMSSMSADEGPKDRGGSIVALPITQRYSEHATGSGSPLAIFDTLVLGRGTEVLPWSSSAMGKMKQKNCVH